MSLRVNPEYEKLLPAMSDEEFASLKASIQEEGQHYAIIVVGILLIIFGWREIFNGKGKLVTTGLYSRTRHPQYLGFLILTFGMNLEWTTIFTIILWPFLAILYYKLAKQEDKENEEQFGEEYLKYKQSVPSFFPRLRKSNAA